jgi:hypothetical protein
MQHEDTCAAQARPEPLRFGPIRWFLEPSASRRPTQPVTTTEPATTERDATTDTPPSNGHTSDSNGHDQVAISQGWWSRVPGGVTNGDAPTEELAAPAVPPDFEPERADDSGASRPLAVRERRRVVVAATAPTARRSTGRRFLAAVVAIVLISLIGATVLLWQEVENTRHAKPAPRTITITGLAEVQHRLDAVEARLAAMQGSGSAPAPAIDPLGNQISALEQCVVQFQRAIVDVQAGRPANVTYC